MEQSSRDGLSSETFLNPCPSFRPCAQSTPIKNSSEKLPVEEVFANSESEPDIFDESVDSVSKANTSHVSIEVFDASFEAPGANASNSIEVFDLSSEDSNVPVDVESFESTQKSSKTITKVPEANASHLSIEVFDLSSEDIECEDAEKGCESSQNASSIRNSNDTDKEQNLETLQKSSNKEDSVNLNHLKFSGKRVFLFLKPSKKSTGRVQDFVTYLGAHVVNFLQKNVDVIIMDMTLARKAPLLPKAKLTRTQQLIEKSVKKSGSSSLKSFAEKWNIPIIDHIDVLHRCKTYLYGQELLHIEHRKRLGAPFLKMEDQSRKYRPEYVEFNKSFPYIEKSVPLPNSPFDTWYKQNAIKNKDIVDKKRNQLKFCELCHEKYTVLESHLDTVKHKEAARDNVRFSGVDALIKRGGSLEEFAKRMIEKHNTNKLR